MKRTFRRFVLLIILFILLVWFWDSYRTTTYEVATIRMISENEMTIKNVSDEERTIVVPVDMTHLVEINKEYTILYDKRLFDKYRLRGIGT